MLNPTRHLLAASLLCAIPALAFTTADVGDHAGSGPGGFKLPADYRDWRFISLAHEADGLNDIRVVLGNQKAVDAYRRGTRPFPDGTVIVRLAYKYGPSAENDAIFGKAQSFVAGAPTNVQLEAKDSAKYAKTGGWTYAQFKDGKADPTAESEQTCFACHNRLPAKSDLVFTNYSP